MRSEDGVWVDWRPVLLLVYTLVSAWLLPAGLTLFNRIPSVHQWMTHFALTRCYKSTVLLSRPRSQKR